MDPSLPYDVHTQMYIKDEWYIGHLPRFERIFETRILMSVIIYILVFQFLGYLSKIFLWREASGFRQYRLRNITICFLHSLICGIFVFYFAVTRFSYLINNPIFYSEPWMDRVLLMSIGYFIHDSIDMSKYELSKYSIELFVHHTITSSVIMISVISEYFITFAYSSLLMEVNSVFLHLRTLFQLSGASITYPRLFNLIKYTNILTFIMFRFIAPAIQQKFVWDHRHNFRFFYLMCSFGIGIVLYTINIFLFIRIIAADGYLGEYGRRYAANGRDKDAKLNQNGKSS